MQMKLDKDENQTNQIKLDKDENQTIKITEIKTLKLPMTIAAVYITLIVWLWRSDIANLNHSVIRFIAITFCLSQSLVFMLYIYCMCICVDGYWCACMSL